MASVFTYETDPVRVGSPWPRTPANGGTGPSSLSNQNLAPAILPPAEMLSDYGISKLIPEPQEGPVEYKLHLLLRPRRSFSATSTVQKVSGSHLSTKSRASPSLGGGVAHESNPTNSRSSTPLLAPSNVSKQNRLQHLTTQLLWRLQQSSPNHSSSKSDLVLPVLPDDDEAEISALRRRPRQLIAGLEESLGALYEIGVSDDGSFVGLTRDEIDESLNVLRAMSHSLGCQLQVLRLVDVGHCEWSEEVEVTEQVSKKTSQQSQTRKENLYVTEVQVGPHVGLHYKPPSTEPPMATGIPSAAHVENQSSSSSMPLGGSSSNEEEKQRRQQQQQYPDCQQLRVTLTGSTTSGKSSLLGTLSTSTLDNGRGKSRLSLLKHRHEIASGLTSSLAQELIGYHNVESPERTESSSSSFSLSSPTSGAAAAAAAARIEIVNYSSPNVSSWTDIHNAARPNRLVFVTDSAGHPRYRRTTVRGVFSWAPHWTLCCVAADDDEDNTGKIGATASANDILGCSGQGVDLSKAYLELCLKLDLPLVIVITKYDLASKAGLRQTLTKILSTLKDAGRRPAMLPLDPSERPNTPPSCPTFILKEDAITKVIASTPPADLNQLVPIVLTSAVSGIGIAKVHSLLRQLPILPVSAAGPIPSSLSDSAPLFHIDEVFTKPQQRGESGPDMEFIVSGYLRHGTIGVGDRVSIGPFTEEAPLHSPNGSEGQFARSYPSSHGLTPRSSRDKSTIHRASFGSLKHLARIRTPSPEIVIEWHTVIVTSIRNLRLPVRQLFAGQVATIAINFSTHSPIRTEHDNSSLSSGLRKGMVLLHAPGIDEGGLPAYSSFTAIFNEPNTYVFPGSSVTVYIASIRASAKIVEVRVPDNNRISDDVFDLDSGNEDGDASTLTGSVPSLMEKEPQIEAIEITFKFASSSEWIEVGTQVLVTPASGLSMLNPLEQGDTGSTGTGLDGFVGRIVTVV